MRSILVLEPYDKQDKIFRKRDKTKQGEPSDAEPFPDLDREALEYVLDAVNKKYSAELRAVRRYKEELGKQKKKAGKKISKQVSVGELGRTNIGSTVSANADLDDIKLRIAHLRAYEQEQVTQNIATSPDISIEDFVTGLDSNDFAKLYAFAIEQCTPASKELLVNTKGKWIKYPQGSIHTPLVKSLQGHGTGWCTAGESTAQAQLEDGDFYVYYSHDQKGIATIPRAAIRMQGGGIAEEQNLDPHIAPIVATKLQEFPDGKQYEKKAENMKYLTTIETKMRGNKSLTKPELTFLYELDSTIEGFGYEKDPRINELRQACKQANLLDQDILTIFECAPDQIAHTQLEVDQAIKDKREIKVYVGSLFDDMFDVNVYPQLAHIEHIYASFPEGSTHKRTTWIGGEDTQTMKDRMTAERVNFVNAQFLLYNEDFTTSKYKCPLDTVRIKVRDLGFPNGATKEEIYAKADRLGLDLCPREVGPHYRLQYLDQPMNEYVYIGMEPISVPDGCPDVFYLHRAEYGLWLHGRWASPQDPWRADDEVVFSLRK